MRKFASKRYSSSEESSSPEFETEVLIYTVALEYNILKRRDIMFQESTMTVDDYIFQITETDAEFIISVCPLSEYEEDTSVPFHLLDICAKADGYTADNVKGMIQTNEYVLFAVKCILDDCQFEKKCNSSMSKEISTAANAKEKPQRREAVRLSEKPFLTLKEMARYSGIGEKKLEWMIENYQSFENDFSFRNGTKKMFKREKFIAFVNGTDVI